MSDKKRGLPRVCGNCGRICRWDLERKFCPVTQRNIHAGKPADKCGFYNCTVARRHGRED